VLPALVNEHDASHGVQWIDFDGDGALDLALTNNDPAAGTICFATCCRLRRRGNRSRSTWSTREAVTLSRAPRSACMRQARTG